MCSQYYLEKNLDAREKDLEREAELEDKAPKVKAKSKMSKVSPILVFTPTAKENNGGDLSHGFIVFYYRLRRKLERNKK